jgi:hypothetical protein
LEEPLLDWLEIGAATVYFGAGSLSSYLRGYNYTSGTWTNNNTLAYSSFVAQPTIGRAPLWVWLTDMSIAPSNWNWKWTFADGSTGTERSGFHTYTTWGFFSLLQEVSSPGNPSSSSDQVIEVLPSVAHMPAINLLLLD